MDGCKWFTISVILFSKALKSLKEKKPMKSQLLCLDFLKSCD